MGLNTEHKFWVWVTILGHTSLHFFTFFSNVMHYWYTMTLHNLVFLSCVYIISVTDLRTRPVCHASLTSVLWEYKSFCMCFVIFINERYNLSTSVSPKSPLSTHTPGWQITAPLGLPRRSVLIAPNGIRPQRAWLQYRPAGHTAVSYTHTHTY